MIFVVGQVFKEKELVGYRLLDLSAKSSVDLPLDSIRKICSTQDIPFVNAQYKKDSGILIGTQGSLTNYQSIYSNGVLFKQKKLAICYKIIDKDTKQLGGYGVCDGYGMLINVKMDKLISLCSKYDMSNFTLKQNLKGKYEVIPLGADFPSVEMQVIQAKKGYNSNLGEKDDGRVVKCSEIKDSNNSTMLPSINIYSYDDIKESEFAMPAQEKMFKAYANMKKLSPYYHTILMSVKREATLAVPTMGVTEDTMYYNLEFVSKLSIAEITFVLIHEVCHMAMRHSVRHGNKDNRLWNIATDLYINSIIARDFECYYGEPEKTIETNLGSACIKVPIEGIHLSTIGESLDFGKDTPESIYMKLVKENPPQQNQQGQQGQGQQGQGQQGQGQQGQGQQGQGQSQSSQQQAQQGVQQVMQGAQQAQQNCGNSAQSQQAMQQIQQGAQQLQQGIQNGNQQQAQQGAQQMQNGVNQMNQAQSQAGQSGTPQGNSASQQMQNGMNQINNALNQSQGSGQGQGQGQGSASDLTSQGKSVSNDRSSLASEGNEESQGGIYNKTQEVTVVYNGKKLTGKIPMDVMTAEVGDSKDRDDRMKENALSTTQAMKTAVEIKEEKDGQKLVKNAGSGAGLIQRCIEFGLSTLVDWRTLLKNMCKTNPKKMYTLASPNEVYMNAGVTVASRRKMGKPTEIKGIKICIDVSGSISESELQYYLSEVNNILQHFKVEGELIYWSTIIGDAGNFSDLKGMLKVQPNSTGGTDVKCVFDYLSGKTRVNKQFEKTKVKDISCVLIFTDGCFSNNYEEYKQYFGKKVIWVIPDSKFMFKPPFGKIACLN